MSHLWKLKIRLVATINTGIPIDNQNYYPYESGNFSDVFINANYETKTTLIGKAKSGQVAYPDFFKQSTDSWWY